MRGMEGFSRGHRQHLLRWESTKLIHMPARAPCWGAPNVPRGLYFAGTQWPGAWRPPAATPTARWRASWAWGWAVRPAAASQGAFSQANARRCSALRPRPPLTPEALRDGPAPAARPMIRTPVLHPVRRQALTDGPAPPASRSTAASAPSAAPERPVGGSVRQVRVCPIPSPRPSSVPSAAIPSTSRTASDDVKEDRHVRRELLMPQLRRAPDPGPGHRPAAVRLLRLELHRGAGRRAGRAAGFLAGPEDPGRPSPTPSSRPTASEPRSTAAPAAARRSLPTPPPPRPPASSATTRWYSPSRSAASWRRITSSLRRDR